MSTRQIKGVVLAGGKSSRFGEDKALALWDGKTLLERVVNLLGDLQLDPVVIANLNRDYSFLSCPVFNDEIPEKGPLGGLYTAGSLFPEVTLLVLTCDMPFLTAPALKQLIKSHTASAEATVFSIEGKTQPFPGIYEPALKMLILNRLESGELSMRSFLSCIFQRKVIDARDLKVFQNVNCPEDLDLNATAESLNP